MSAIQLLIVAYQRLGLDLMARIVGRDTSQHEHIVRYNAALDAFYRS